jgi:hypothetical protein
MDLGRLVKWIVILAVLYFAWTNVVPWLKKQNASTTTSSTSTADSPCVRAAEQASESWGGGIARFAKPNPDSTEWQTFRGMVEGRISSAESSCSCQEQSCATAREALRDLRGVVSDMDNALRSNSMPPDDIVQRQEAIDNKINEARDQLRAGK